MLSRRFLRSLWKVLKLKHKRQDGTFERFNPDDLPESPDDFVSDARRGLPPMKACEYPVAAKAKDGNTTTVPAVPFGISDILQRQLDNPAFAEGVHANDTSKEIITH